jgi:hypothetical protein
VVALLAEEPAPDVMARVTSQLVAKHQGQHEDEDTPPGPRHGVSGSLPPSSKLVLDCVPGLGRLRKWGYAGFIMVRASGE